MKSKIEIFDTTLRDGEQAPDNTMTPEEKLEIAIKLEEIGVDIIEAGFPISSKEDFEGVELVSKNLKKSTVCALARCIKEDIDACRKSLEPAKKKCLHLFLATSDLHLEKKLKKDKEKAFEIITKNIEYSQQYFDNIIFSAEDATRTNRDFLLKVYTKAHELGVDVLNIPDTTGYSHPFEIYELVTDIKNTLPDSKLSIHCHNDLGLATANTLAAIQAGAEQIQTTVNGIGERAGNASFEESVTALKIRKDFFDKEVDIDFAKLVEVSELVYKIIGRVPSHEKAVVGVNAFRHEAGIHIDGILKDPKTYEIINPELLSRKREFIKGRHSGKSSHEYKNKIKDKKIREAYNKIRDGGLSIIPSRVGYTLIGFSDESIQKMYSLKGRPLSKPCVVLTKRNMLDEIAKIPKKYIELINEIDEKNILCGFRLKRKSNHPFYDSLGEFSNKYSKDNEDTSMFVINAGRYFEHLVNQSIDDAIFVVGSSANKSGTGNEGIFNEIPENIRKGVDFAVEDDDFVSAGYNPETREQGVMLDLTKDSPLLIREGYMQEEIEPIISKY